MVPSSGLQVRNYVQLQHDWFFGNPSAPFLNGTFQPSSALFRAVGQPDDSIEWFRHMTLISPRHFVYASHYAVSNSWSLRFLGSNNMLLHDGISDTVPVKNAQGQNTDLLLGTLTTDIDTSTGVIPFPVLNLANETAYSGLTLQVFGKSARSSSMPLAGFDTLVNDPGFDTTRFAYFDYPSSGSPPDCNYEGGDSGCPAFIIINGYPALIGTASGQDPINGNSRNYLNFIPAYLTQLDTLMEAQGYHVKRFYPAATSVMTTATATSTLRRTKPGCITLSAQTSGAADAQNVSLQLTFSNAPSTVSGSGWFCQASSATVWKCHRGGITAGSSAVLSATWNALPLTETMQVTLDRTFDGAATNSTSSTLPLQETYTSWSSALADSAVAADPDHDGIGNLIEYAFGGDPTVSSLLSADGRSLGLKIQKSGSNLIIRYPRRTDATSRGLTYTPEVSTTLSVWTAVLPSGSTTAITAFFPASTGYEEASLTIPISQTERFVRVRVGLIE
jgi:hypothetical protein